MSTRLKLTITICVLATLCVGLGIRAYWSDKSSNANYGIESGDHVEVIIKKVIRTEMSAYTSDQLYDPDIVREVMERANRELRRRSIDIYSLKIGGST